MGLKRPLKITGSLHKQPALIVRSSPNHLINITKGTLFLSSHENARILEGLFQKMG